MVLGVLTYEEHRVHARGGCRGRLTIVLDDDWLFFDTPNTVLDVLIGAWRAPHTDVEDVEDGVTIG